jgi:hypothetical protein
MALPYSPPLACVMAEWQQNYFPSVTQQPYCQMLFRPQLFPYLPHWLPRP